MVIGLYISIAGSQIKCYREHLVAPGCCKNKGNSGEIFVKISGENENKRV